MIIGRTFPNPYRHDLLARTRTDRDSPQLTRHVSRVSGLLVRGCELRGANKVF
nr:MAG TPA: hypothetical protein [Bacteriophage sp.]